MSENLIVVEFIHWFGLKAMLVGVASMNISYSDKSTVSHMRMLCLLSGWALQSKQEFEVRFLVQNPQIRLKDAMHVGVVHKR